MTKNCFIFLYYDIRPYGSFILSMRFIVYRLAVSDLRFKTRIPIKEGCLLMGVADPVGVLQEDEIFVQIRVDDCSPPKVQYN